MKRLHDCWLNETVVVMRSAKVLVKVSLTEVWEAAGKKARWGGALGLLWPSWLMGELLCRT